MADISDRLEALIQTIQNVSSLGASFVYDVGKLLESFGYEMQDGDDMLTDKEEPEKEEVEQEELKKQTTKKKK